MPGLNADPGRGRPAGGPAGGPAARPVPTRPVPTRPVPTRLAPARLTLARAVARTVPWRTIGTAGGLGLLLALVPRLLEDRMTGWLVVNTLRASAVAFAGGLAFLLDDPARHTTAVVPTRRAVRYGLRAALVVPVAALWWTAVLLLVPQDLRPPAAGITLEAAAVLVLAPAAAAFAVRRSGALRPGQSVAGALLVCSVLAPLLWPERWPLFVTPDDGRWAAAHDRWTALLCAALAVGAVCLTEPLRRRTVPWGAVRRRTVPWGAVRQGAMARGAVRAGVRSPSGTSGPSRG